MLARYLRGPYPVVLPEPTGGKALEHKQGHSALGVTADAEWKPCPDDGTRNALPADRRPSAGTRRLETIPHIRAARRRRRGRGRRWPGSPLRAGRGTRRRRRARRDRGTGLRLRPLGIRVAACREDGPRPGAAGVGVAWVMRSARSIRVPRGKRAWSARRPRPRGPGRSTRCARSR